VSSNGIAYATIGAGGVFFYAAITGKSVTQTIQYLVMGKSPQTLQPVSPITGMDTTPADKSPTTTGDTSGGGSLPVTGVGGSAAKNKAIGRLLAAGYGWGSGAQWEALNNLVMAESGWNNTATNGGRPYNSFNVAYGIPQALPASKMGVAANPPYSSATAQIKWMLGAYIKPRYGDPIRAWQFHLANGWY
jgi:hypothetical protein